MQTFPPPIDATHKIWSRLANWLQRYSGSKVWNFRHSRANNSKMSGLIWPKFECVRAFMPVLVISNFDDDSIKNERASMETLFSLYKSEIFRRSRAWLCWGLTSQSTIFQSCRDGAIASWVINQYFRGVKCLAQGHNTAAVGLEPRTSRSGVRHSTTEPPRSPDAQGQLTP